MHVGRIQMFRALSWAERASSQRAGTDPDRCWKARKKDRRVKKKSSAPASHSPKKKYQKENRNEAGKRRVAMRSAPVTRLKAGSHRHKSPTPGLLHDQTIQSPIEIGALRRSKRAPREKTIPRNKSIASPL
jgi:hypothetical protein